jgi:hypothetical protein
LSNALSDVNGNKENIGALERQLESNERDLLNAKQELDFIRHIMEACRTEFDQLVQSQQIRFDQLTESQQISDGVFNAVIAVVVPSLAAYHYYNEKKKVEQ